MIYTQDALTIIAEIGRDRFPMQEFDARMDAKGWSRDEVRHALASLERRNWAAQEGTTIYVSDEGYAAATDGVGVPTCRQRPTGAGSGRSPKTRMPRGLI